jgi:uncharacterized membrane protein (DUF485 family)
VANREIVDAPVPASQRASLFEDFIDIFTAPSQVYARRANGNFWLVLLILAVVFAVLGFAGRATYQTLIEAEFARNTPQMMEANPELTEDQLAQMRRFGTMGAKVMMYVGMPLLILVVGLVAWVAGKIFGATLTYGQAALIVAYAQVPRVLGSIAFLVQGLLVDPATAGGFAAYSIGPARFMDPATTSAGLMQFLARLDLFVLWPTLLIGIGIAVIGRVPREKGYLAAALVWLIGSATAIWGALMG